MHIASSDSLLQYTSTDKLNYFINSVHSLNQLISYLPKSQNFKTTDKTLTAKLQKLTPQS